IILLIGLAPSPTQAGEPTSEDIVHALTPATRSVTRSWTNNRGVTMEQSTEPVGPPSINLYINFAFDSAKLQTDSLITLEKLATALRDNRLASYVFLIGGHTDAKGSDEYNQNLSDRRADAVRSFLIRKYGIDTTRLIAKGYGETNLADPAHPEDG